jgi:hypothetical protein
MMLSIDLNSNSPRRLWGNDFYLFFLVWLRLRVLSVRSRYCGADGTTHLYIFGVFVTFDLFIEKKASTNKQMEEKAFCL